MNGLWKCLRKSKQRKGKVLLWGKPPPAPVRRPGSFWCSESLPTLDSLAPYLPGWRSLVIFPQQLTHLYPRFAPKLVSCFLLLAETGEAAHHPVWKCHYLCKIEQDQTLFPGVITAVILVAVSVNKEKYSAALENLIAHSQDVACTGFLL